MSLVYTIQSMAFVLALSLDAFAASLAYGMQGIKIPKKSALAVSLICTVLVAVGIEIGAVLQGILPQSLISAVSTLILVVLGFIKLFEFSIKRWIRQSGSSPKKDFYFLNFHFLLEVICDTTRADADMSKELSLKEAYALAFVLSLDGFAAGVGAGLSGFDTGAVAVLSLIFGMAAIIGGELLGKRIAEKTEMDLSWISGIILLALAILKS